MNLVIGAVTIGLILALLGLGVFLSYRVYHLVDLTADGSFGIGVAVAAALLVKGVPPLLATLAAVVAGALAGGITGFLHTRFHGERPAGGGAHQHGALLGVPVHHGWGA